MDIVRRKLVLVTIGAERVNKCVLVGECDCSDALGRHEAARTSYIISYSVSN